MKIDLGGWLSQRSLLRRLGAPVADALLRVWLEPMLLSVVMLRDKVRGISRCGVVWCDVVLQGKIQGPVQHLTAGMHLCACTVSQSWALVLLAVVLHGRKRCLCL